MLIHSPGETPGICDTPVSHLDVMPTVLDLLSINTPDDIDGISLAPTVRNETLPPERPIFSQYSGAHPPEGCLYTYCRRAVISRRFKYIYDPATTPELYDLEQDPLETTNIAGLKKYADIEQQLHEEGRKWAEEYNDWVEF